MAYHGGNVYSAGDDSVSFLVADTSADIIRIAGNAGAIYYIHEVRIGQTSDAGDANAEQLPIAAFRYTTAGSGSASTPAIVSKMPGAPTAKAVITLVEDSIASGLSGQLVTDAWNVQGGFVYTPAPEDQDIVAAVATEGIVFHCTKTVQSNLTLCVSITWEEVLIT